MISSSSMTRMEPFVLHNVTQFLRRTATAERPPTAGSDRVNRVPCPTVLSHVNVPSCSRTMP